MKLKKDFIIPAGEEASSGPLKTEYYTPHWQFIIKLGKDAAATLMVDEDGREWLKENNYI